MRLQQRKAPTLDALRALERRPIAGFGGPGHHHGRGASRDVLRLLGLRVFRADVLTPKGMDDRRESAQVLQRAYALAAEAWGGDVCRFSTGGSTQNVQTALSTLAAPGDIVVVAQNAHWAEFNAAVIAGLDVRIVPVVTDRTRNMEHGVDPEVLEATLRRNAGAKAVVVVSPTIFGVTSDVAALAGVAHRYGIPLVVDAAWGAAFPFCTRLPVAASTAGADVMICSLHKTLGALAQGSIIVVRGDLVDRQRLAMVFDMYESTSPSVPIIASMDATRREHALHGNRLWRRVLRTAETTARRLRRIEGLTVYGREVLGGPGAFDRDESKVTISVKALGMTGFQADEWLQRNRRVSVVLSDLDNIVVAIGLGTSGRDVDRLVAGLEALVRASSKPGGAFRRPAGDVPAYGDLDCAMAGNASQAFYARTETIAIRDAAGRIAAEVVAPSPPATPRLIPGQRISAAHVAFLIAHLDGGAFLPDPSAHGPQNVRVVAE